MITHIWQVFPSHIIFLLQPFFFRVLDPCMWVTHELLYPMCVHMIECTTCISYECLYTLHVYTYECVYLMCVHMSVCTISVWMMYYQWHWYPTHALVRSVRRERYPSRRATRWSRRIITRQARRTSWQGRCQGSACTALYASRLVLHPQQLTPSNLPKI